MAYKGRLQGLLWLLGLQSALFLGCLSLALDWARVQTYMHACMHACVSLAVSNETALETYFPRTPGHYRQACLLPCSPQHQSSQQTDLLAEMLGWPWVPPQRVLLCLETRWVH